MLTSKRKIEIKESAVGVLQTADIHSLPVDLNRIIDCYGWCYLTFADAQAEGLQTPSNEDGCTISQLVDNRWFFTILYNEKKIPCRCRWTITHEIGHIILGHISNQVPHVQANEEAQYFAEQLLSPIAVVVKLGAATVDDIARLCNLSSDAAQWRMKDLERHRWYYEKYGYTAQDKKFLRQFCL